MKMRNGMYLFAAAIVASTVGLSSCSNDEEGVGGTDWKNGPTKDVTLSLSVKKVSKRITSDEANQGNTIQEIKDIWVVPMVGNEYLQPISMGNITPTNASPDLKKVATLNTSINKFVVYGNVGDSDGTWSESSIFVEPEFSLMQKTGVPEAIKSTTYEPYPMYYYGLAGEGTNPIKGYTDKDFTQGEATITAGDPIGSSYAAIKVSGVNYGVGLLAAAVLNGDEDEVFYPTNNGGTLEGDAVGADEAIEIAGVLINGQYTKLNKTFDKAADASEGNVYEEAADVILKEKSAKIAFANNKVANANIYSVVAKTEAEKNVTMNIVFKIKQGHFIKNNSGQILGEADKDAYAFLGVILDAEKASTTEKCVFQKDFTTLLNATVTDWGNLSGEEVITTDVNLGVEIDTEWQQGIAYDVEI